MNPLLLGIAFTALGLILLFVVYWRTRGDSPAALFSDGWVANIHIPLLIGLLTFGGGFLIKFLATLV